VPALRPIGNGMVNQKPAPLLTTSP
jgi:hypothetical protein